MAEFNKFSLYSMGYEAVKKAEKDEIDLHIEYLNKENSYEEARTYLMEHFGEIEHDKWVEFPEISKTCYLLVTDERVEFCAQKNHQDYYGKGWLKHKEK